MTIVKRLRLLTAVLGCTAASAVVGSVVFGDVRVRPEATPVRPDPSVPATDEAARTKFSNQPALTFKTPAGETVFAWQIKPTLPAQPDRPRDVLVMVDTSASQAGRPLAQARSILAAFAREAGREDRLDLWTININHPAATRSLTGGFQPVNEEAIQKAIAQLEDAEYGSGAVDLKAGLEQAIKKFEKRPGRNQVLLYLGDGESAASPKPLSEAGRIELGHALSDKEIAFFAVPLGMTVHPHNLHGLATMSGGTIIRPGDPNRPRTEFVARLKQAFDAPILRSDREIFGPEGMELYPTRLPPMRADQPTLVVGKLKAPARTVSVRIQGRVAGGVITLDLSERLPEPNSDHYFLATMLAQWRDSKSQDVPAILPADRALALSAAQFQLFRDEFNTQAVYAITADRLDHAEKLFQAASRIDPDNGEAQAGLRILERVRGGHLSADKVKIRLGTSGTKISTALRELNQDEPKAPAGGGKAPQPPAPPAGTAPQTPAERDLIAQARAAQQVIEQEFRAIVDETLRRARRLKMESPDAAYEDLKNARNSVAANDQLSELVRRRLVQDLEAEMRDVQVRGAEINRRLAAERQRVARARQSLIETERLRIEEEQTKARIDQFRQLMQQARFELAQAEAQTMIEERISQGMRVPPESLAAFRIGQSATHLREHFALKRLRENNWLLTMMQVEKSFIPYPDEPPVHFPPAAVWRQLTGQRVEKYGTYSLGENAPNSFRRLRSVLEGEVDKRVNIKNLNALDLQTLLNQLQSEFQEYGVRFVFRTDLLPVDFKPTDVKIKTTSDLSGLPLGAFLDVVLRDTEQGLSWIARPEFIEIGPLMELRYDEKVTKVFDVADLVIAIPQSVNPATLYQNLQFVGAGATIFGSAFNPFGGLGGLGQFGFGALGAGALGAGGLGAGALGAGALGAGGLGMGGALGMGGGLGMGGQGGVLGAFGQGGNTGGFNGNPLGGLSGQFGIQGNDQSMFLIQLITSVVARGEWDLRSAMVGGQQAFSQDLIDNTENTVEARQRNSLGFYPPARALIIRGSHRYHPTSSFKLKKSDGGMGAGGPGLPREGGLAGNVPPGSKPPVKDPAGSRPSTPVASRNTGRDTTRLAVEAVARKTAGDPKKLWNETFDAAVTSPALVIDTCDVLFQMNEYQHAAEALKATLRKGRANGDWAHEALAIALQAQQAAPAEVERAVLSLVDLGPDNPKAFLKAAKAESELGHHDVALAFCQRAAALEPNSPAAYVDALAYAERTGDVKSDVVHWASTNLLHRDWADDGFDYHAQARERVVQIARKLESGGRKDDASKLQSVLAQPTTRDLVIELLWQGKRCDLDLTVIEPSGSRCSATHKRTTGGGVLKADVLEQELKTENDRSETYTAAQAFSGTYTVLVKKALGDTANGRATIKVTRFTGTPQQTTDLFTVDLNSPQPIQVRLDGGTRTELASVPADEEFNVREDTTHSPRTTAPTGISAGVAAGSESLMTTEGAAKAAIPLVNSTREARVPGVAGLPGLRVEAKVAPDRTRVVMSANPVFVGPARDLPLPKVNLLPGGE